MNGEMDSIVKISSNAVRELTSDIKKRLKKSNPGVEHIKVDITKDSYFFRAKIEMQENMFHFICEKKHACGVKIQLLMKYFFEPTDGAVLNICIWL